MTNLNVTNVLKVVDGGTGVNSVSTGDLPYASATNVLSKLPIGEVGQVLKVATSTTFGWADVATIPMVFDINNTSSGAYDSGTHSWNVIIPDCSTSATISEFQTQGSHGGLETTNIYLPHAAEYPTGYVFEITVITGAGYTTLMNVQWQSGPDIDNAVFLYDYSFENLSQVIRGHRIAVIKNAAGGWDSWGAGRIPVSSDHGGTGITAGDFSAAGGVPAFVIAPISVGIGEKYSLFSAVAPHSLLLGAASAYTSPSWLSTGTAGQVLLAADDGFGNMTPTWTSIGLSATPTAVGDIEYSSDGSTFSILPIGVDGTFLSVASGIPSWAYGSLVPASFDPQDGQMLTSDGAGGWRGKEAYALGSIWTSNPSGTGTEIPGSGMGWTNDLINPGRLMLSNETFSNAAHTLTDSISVARQIGTMSASRVLTLPLANAYPAGAILMVIDESGTVGIVNTIVVTRAGSDTINGGTTMTIAVAYGCLFLMSDGVSKYTKVSGIL